MSTILSPTGTITFLHPILSPTAHLRRTNHHINPPSITSHRQLNISTTFNKKPFSLKPLSISNSSSITPQILNPNPNSSKFPQIPQSLLNSTKTLTALVTLSISLAYKLAQFVSTTLHNLTPLHQDVLPTVGPLLFAAIKSRSRVPINTPLTIVATGMSKWLDLYSGVLLVRVFLSWFPNIPWDRQPLSAIRDLCDPYLSLYRNIIPPLFGALDVSPILAFTVLGVFGGILKSARAGAGAGM